MSAKLPAFNGKQVIAAFEKEGWYVKRVSIPDAILVPVHGPDRSSEERSQASCEPPGSAEKFAELLW